MDLRDYEPQQPYVLWEVYAGEGRITRTANRREHIKGERFSREDGWDFDKAAHRRAFLRRLREEKPDAVMWSPVCTLWSNLQELANATNPARQATLETRRLEDHATHLTFVAMGYEYQRREGRIGIVEHPYSSRAWSTDAFSAMKGYDVALDMCEYGLKLPDEERVINPVLKPTNLRVTSMTLVRRLGRRCRGDHQHTPLEGHVPGLGRRSTLAENYTQMFATQIVNSVVAAIETEDALNALEDLPPEDSPALTEGIPAVDDEPVKKNKELKSRVGARAVNYVARLHKNLGHCGSEILERMLREVQATEDVLEAARSYVCPQCYMRKPPAQAPPASALKCTAFNDRILVDSHWIQCVDTIIKSKVPAPGTPAAARKEKKKKESPQGRQCVLTIVDHATRYCAIRIIKSEKAEEFTKGVERAWVKHFGLPKIIRVDEAKGWGSKHVREWCSSRGMSLEVQPAEQHSWLGVVERKHQVIRRALEVYV